MPAKKKQSMRSKSTVKYKKGGSVKKKKSACGPKTKKSFQAGMSIGRNMKKKKKK